MVPPTPPPPPPASQNGEELRKRRLNTKFSWLICTCRQLISAAVLDLILVLLTTPQHTHTHPLPQKKKGRNDAHTCSVFHHTMFNITLFSWMYLDPSVDGSMQIVHTSPYVTRLYQQGQMASTWMQSLYLETSFICRCIWRRKII